MLGAVRYRTAGGSLLRGAYQQWTGVIPEEHGAEYLGVVYVSASGGIDRGRLLCAVAEYYQFDRVEGKGKEIK
jgi:hypothetical protein